MAMTMPMALPRHNGDACAEGGSDSESDDGCRRCQRSCQGSIVIATTTIPMATWQGGRWVRLSLFYIIYIILYIMMYVGGIVEMVLYGK